MQPFKEYLRLGKVKWKTPDAEEAKALLAKAEARLAYTQEKSLTSEKAVFILEDAYEAAREAAQSLMSREGFKPYSHEGTISFLAEFHGEETGPTLLNSFERFRKLRHDTIYKAVLVTTGEAESALRFAEGIVAAVKRIAGR